MISFLATAFRDPLRVGLRPARQIFQRGQDALQFRVEIFLLVFAQLLERDLQDVPVSAGRDRKFMLEIAQEKTAGVVVHLQLAPFQNAAVLIAQNRNQHLVAQVGFERLPVDIEIRRVNRARPVLQNIGPPEILRLADAHVVRDEIEHLTHPAGVEFRDPGVVFRARPDGRVQLVVIGNVVAVQALGPRLEIRRSITVADPERVQVRHKSARLREGEVAIELEAISGAGNARRHGMASLRGESRDEQDLRAKWWQLALDARDDPERTEAG